MASSDTPTGRRLSYQEPDCSLTLRDGLRVYAESEPSLTRAADAEAECDLGAHDAQHVVFGCDTSVRGEILLTRWSLFGATDWVPFYIKGLRHRETRGLILDFLGRARPLVLIGALVESLRCLARSLRMKRRWPSDDFARYLDMPLVDIRRDFGIRVL